MDRFRISPIGWDGVRGRRCRYLKIIEGLDAKSDIAYNLYRNQEMERIGLPK